MGEHSRPSSLSSSRRRANSWAHAAHSAACRSERRLSSGVKPPATKRSRLSRNQSCSDMTNSRISIRKPRALAFLAQHLEASMQQPTQRAIGQPQLLLNGLVIGPAEVAQPQGETVFL